jgi:hypothetical protein
MQFVKVAVATILFIGVSIWVVHTAWLNERLGTGRYMLSNSISQIPPLITYRTPGTYEPCYTPRNGGATMTVGPCGEPR